MPYCRGMAPAKKAGGEPNHPRKKILIMNKFKLEVTIAGRCVHSEILNMTKDKAIAYVWDYAKMDADDINVRALVPDASILWLRATWYSHYDKQQIYAYYILTRA